MRFHRLVRPSTGILLDFLLNDAEAAELILADRGMPFNAEILAVVEPLLDPRAATAAAFIQDVLQAGIVAPPQPSGGAEMNSLSQRMESDVLFGNRTVEEAVDYWMDFMEDALN